MKEIVTVTTSNVLPDPLVLRDVKNEMKNEVSSVNADSFVAYNTKSSIATSSGLVDKDTDIVMGQIGQFNSISTTLFGVYGETIYSHCKYN